MLPQLSGIPLPTTDTSSDSSRNLNRTLPVGQNVSATVVAVSKDQIQPEIFRLKLEINNRLIQMGVFQSLPVGQKINVNRQSDGQIQITPQSPSSKTTPDSPLPSQKPHAQPNTPAKPNLNLSFQTTNSSANIPTGSKTTAAVISSRPIYPQSTQSTLTNATVSTNTALTPTFSNAEPASKIIIPPQSPQQVPALQTKSTSSQPVSNTDNSQVTRNTAPAQSTSSSPQITSSEARPNQTISGQTANHPPAAPLDSGSNKNHATPLIHQTTRDSNASNLETKAGTLNRSDTSTAPKENSQVRASIPAAATATTANNSQPISPPTHHAITLALSNGSKIEVTSPQPLAQGTQLQITKTNNQQFQVLQLREPINSPSSALERPAVQETLRHSLPNQIPTADAFSQLSQVASKAEGPQAAQISSVVKSMLQLFGVRPGSQEAPAQIKQNLELGGLSTEHNLSKGSSPHPQEMKSQLQQLQKLADSLPLEQKERLEQLLQGIHSRVTSQQLHSLQQWKELPDGGFERVFQLDLPIKNGEQWDNLELRLSREGGSNAAGEMISVWRVRLHFDLEEQGGVDAEIRLSDGHEISTLFWCEHKETAEKLKERSEEFSERLRQCGFENTEVNWHEGIAPEQKQPIHKKLVDLHT